MSSNQLKINESILVDFPKKLHSIQKYLCSFPRNQTIAGLPLLPALFGLQVALTAAAGAEAVQSALAKIEMMPKNM